MLKLISFLTLATALASAVAVPALAQDDGLNEDGEPAGKAVIITDMAQPVSCIGPVAITRIDGKNVQVSPQRFEIEAGEHSMSGAAQIDLRYCPPGGTAARRILDRGDFPPLEGYFEAGKTYFVGFDHSATEAENWGLKVWKIEETD